MAVQVAVCGPARCGEREWSLAYELGRLLAERGAVVICGGYGGVMAAVAAGARSRDGLVVGVLSEADRAGAGPDLSAAVATGLGQARNSVIIHSGDAVVVVGGSWGTLSELALAMRRGGVPVIQLGDGWRPIDAEGRDLPGVLHARTPAEALDLTGLWDSPEPRPAK
ncbi:TIGR00725 family protein [Streptomyces yaanensis]|uniref:TIGR00725 family protein n=1 Tax=Streptomyces yaanensis TaxID=1142239 RepID=A0ABV7SL70_9ACTN|nr:TIGR00725 family protein [Streptomyces sp. CGMCC 4.7035]WNC00277.1 TIGR00725 family protein [Streptomyces sp. CGMCC 4.7035]